MEHLLLVLAEFVLVLGGIGIALVVLFVLGLGAAFWGIARMFSNRSVPRGRRLSEVERLRRQLLEAQNTAYESALAFERTIQQLQQRLALLEGEREASSISESSRCLSQPCQEPAISGKLFG